MITKTLDRISFMTPSWPPSGDKPVILFIHGATLSKTFWENQLHGLAHVCHPVALDLPGHGDSPGEASDSVFDYADAVVSFIRAAGLDNLDIIPCGLSMGGAITQSLLISYPQLFKAGILVNTGARLKVHPVIFESVKSDYQQFIRAVPVTSLSQTTDLSKHEQQIIDIIGNNTQETALRDFTACNQFDVMGDIGQITCPVLVFSADHDLTTPAKFGLWLAENISNTRHVHIDNAGHLSPLEKPGIINEEIVRFLGEI